MEEEVVDETVPATSLSLAEAATEAMAVLLEAMKSVCAIYVVDFRDVLKAQDDAIDELLEKSLIFF